MKIAFGIPHGGNNFVYPYINSLIGLCLTQAQKPYDILKKKLEENIKAAEGHPEMDEVVADLRKTLQEAEDARLLGSILPHGGPYVDDNRTGIAIHLCTKTEDDWVVMVDPDIEFPIDMLEQFQKLIEGKPEVKIVAARVNLLNGLPVFYIMDKDLNTNTHQPTPFEGLREFPYAGTGIIFIHRDVFVKMRETLDHHHFFGRIIRKRKIMGDDFSFCYKAKKAGFKIFGAWDIFGIHHKIYPCPQRYLEKKDLEIRLK